MPADGILNQNRVYNSKQTPVVYRQFNVPQYPPTGELIAPSTDTTLKTYSAGRILARYGSDAPSPELVGKLVNWNPLSTVVSQKTPTHILSDEFIHDMPGIDTTTTVTFTATANRVECTPLLIGLALFSNAIAAANTATIVTAFNTAFKTAVIGVSANTLDTTNVISIQSTATVA